MIKNFGNKDRKNIGLLYKGQQLLLTINTLGGC